MHNANARSHALDPAQYIMDSAQCTKERAVPSDTPPTQCDSTLELALKNLQSVSVLDENDCFL